MAVAKRKEVKKGWWRGERRGRVSREASRSRKYGTGWGRRRGDDYPVGHYGPITKTLSARQWAYQPSFHTSLINWEEWGKEKGKGKGVSLFRPSKCQGNGQALAHGGDSVIPDWQWLLLGTTGMNDNWHHFCPHAKIKALDPSEQAPSSRPVLTSSEVGVNAEKQVQCAQFWINCKQTRAVSHATPYCMHSNNQLHLKWFKAWNL